jgi:hypothetical protein
MARMAFACGMLNSNFAINASRAVSTSADARIVAMTSSMWSMAFKSPSTMWARSSA